MTLIKLLNIYQSEEPISYENKQELFLLSKEALCGQGKRRTEELAESIKMTAWQLFDP